MLTEEIKQKSPEETLNDVRPYFDEVGITRVADITGMDRIGIPVFACIRPDSKSLAVDSGKGVTKEQAKCSAVMEGIERWAQDEYFIKSRAPYGTVAWRFPMVRGAVLSKDFNHHKWLEARYWHTNDPVTVPYYHVFNYEKRLPLHEMCWQSGTNGLAAHSTRTSAILQGLYEIVERDAVTVWMNNGATTGEGKVDNTTVLDDPNRTMLAMCEEGAGVRACVYDVTSDIGVPAYMCLLIDTKADINVYKGYGCNLDSNIALQRSICEAAQSRAVFLSGARDDMRWVRHTLEQKSVSNKQWLDKLAMEHQHPYASKTSAPVADEDAIGFIDSLLVSKGCGHVIVADIMSREHAYVVKVLSENLEGYWNPYIQLGTRAK